MNPFELAIKNEEWPRLRELLLDEASDDRQAVGLPRASELSLVQAAALYQPKLIDTLLERDFTLDVFSAAAAGVLDFLPDPTAINTLVEGFTPFGIATRYGRIEAMEYLLDSGVPVGQPQQRAGFYQWETAAIAADVAVWQPIHIAAVHGYWQQASESLSVLIRHGADIHASSTYGALPIHLAATHGWVNSVETLLELGANIEARTTEVSVSVGDLTGTPPHVSLSYKHTPLMTAVQEGFDNVVSLLLSKHADVAARSSAGETVLHFAARPWWREHTGIVKMLLVAGADPHATNDLGQTPVQIAEVAGYESTASLLG